MTAGWRSSITVEYWRTDHRGYLVFLMLLLLNVILYAPEPARAQVVPVGNQSVAVLNPSLLPFELEGALMAYALPTTPLEPGQLAIKLVPGYWTASGGEFDSHNLPSVDMSGLAIAGDIVYQLSPHWAIGAIASYSHSTSGTQSIVGLCSFPPNCQGGYSQLLPVPGTVSGYSLFGTLIFDPFTGDNFRLPLMAGAGVLGTDSRASGTVTVQGHTLSASSKYSLASPAVSLGLAPQWNVWHFRMIPFGILAIGADHRQTSASLTDLTTGATSTLTSPSGGHSHAEGVGLTIKYNPWNVGFTYVASNLFEGNKYPSISLFTLTFEKVW